MPRSCAISTIFAMGLTVPKTLETAVTASSLTESVSNSSNSSNSKRPTPVLPASGVIGQYTNSAPDACSAICHGTRLEWCSISVTMIWSPVFKMCCAQAEATRLIDSVVPRVKIIFPESVAPINFAMLSRPSS